MINATQMADDAQRQESALQRPRFEVSTLPFNDRKHLVINGTIYYFNDKKSSLGNSVVSSSADDKNANLAIYKKIDALLSEHRKFVTAAQKAGATENRLDAFVLQNIVREIMPASSTATCMYAKRGFGNPTEKVEVRKMPSGSAHYAGLQTCKSAWSCPVCSKRIANARREELLEMLSKHRQTGGIALLVTRTIPHDRLQSISSLSDKLKIAEKKFKSGRAWERLVGDFGIAGTVRNVEVTFGINGWHPHIHEIYFLDANISDETIGKLRLAVLTKWQAACRLAELGNPNEEHGVDIRAGEGAARYITKFGLENEITGWQTKIGSHSLAPFDFLRIYKLTKNREVREFARLLFIEFSAAFKGKKQLVISKNLLERFGLRPDDEAVFDEAEQQIQEDGQVWYSFEPTDWDAIRHGALRGVVLELVRQSDTIDACKAGIDWLIEEAKNYKKSGASRALLPIVLL